MRILEILLDKFSHLKIIMVGEERGRKEKITNNFAQCCQKNADKIF